MKPEDVQVFREKMVAEGVMFCYSGPVSQGLIEEVGQAVRTKMTAQAESKTIIERIFGIFVEQVQNIMNYSAEKLDSLRSGIIIVGREARAYFVLCGNVVDDDNRLKIVRTLREIEGKDKHELKSLYKQRMKQTEIQIGKGAGLGLIDIARKASRPLEYCLQEMGTNRSFFASKATISEEV